MLVWTFKTKKGIGRRREGTWWKAYSRMTVKDLRRRFKEETVAVTLLELVEEFGDVEQRDTENGLRIIEVKLSYPEHREDRYFADLCLTDVGIGLIEPVNEWKERVQ